MFAGQSRCFGLGLVAGGCQDEAFQFGRRGVPGPLAEFFFGTHTVQVQEQVQLVAGGQSEGVGSVEAGEPGICSAARSAFFNSATRSRTAR